MPASFAIHLALTEEQMAWLHAECVRTQKTKSKIIQEILEAHRSGSSLMDMHQQLSAKLDEMAARQRQDTSKTSTDLQILSSYVKEIFRESAANLYRLNAVIDEFKDSDRVRDEVNDYVRKQESVMRTKAIQIQEAGL